jgi:hypothetical protein
VRSGPLVLAQSVYQNGATWYNQYAAPHTLAPRRFTLGAMTERRIVSLNLRMPDDLHAELQRVADEEDRSLTAQINRFLRESIARRRAEQEREEPGR